MMRIFTCLLIFMFIGFAVNAQDKSAQQTVSAQAVRYIRFYPNPATTFINIELQRSISRNHSFQVFNFMGRKVADLQEVNTRARIDLSNFSRGIYIYQLKDANGKVIESGKFQIEK